MIIKMFKIYDYKDGNQINILDNIYDILNKLNNGELEEDDENLLKLNSLIEFIKVSPKYISEAKSVKIFFATNKIEDIKSYDLQQELYQILVELAKSSTLIGEITKQVQEIATDTITDVVNTKLQAIALDFGLEVPKDAIEKVKEIVSTAKTIAVTIVQIISLFCFY